MFSAVSSSTVRAALSAVCQDLCKDEQFEPLDVYRRLAQESKVVYDTEKTKERMREHPLTADIARSHAELLDFVVETMDTHVDAERNTMTSASVVLDGVVDGTNKKKKQKTKERMEWSYAYDRRYAGEPFGTTLTYCVKAAMGYGKANTLVRIVLRFSGHYPASYYQKKDDENGGDAGDENSGDENEDPSAHTKENDENEEASDNEIEKISDDQDEETGDEDENEENGAQEDDAQVDENDEVNDGEVNQELHVLGPDEKNWEYVEEFEFHEDVFEAIHEWYGTDRDLSAQDLLTYLLAFPFTEDEYMVDDRVFDLVFNSESDDEEEES